MNRFAKVFFVAILLLVGANASGTASAADFEVTVNSGSFSPVNRTINQGDRIIWVWGGSGSHTTTHVPSGGGVLWNQTISSSNQEYTRQFNDAGVFNYKCTPHGFTGKITVNAVSGVLDEPGSSSLPALSALNQNTPNPFNAATQIEYSLDKDGVVQLSVFNILGQHVATLVEGFQPGGFHIAHWDGIDANGNGVSSGIYFARMATTGVVMTRKMVLLR